LNGAYLYQIILSCLQLDAANVKTKVPRKPHTTQDVASPCNHVLHDAAAKAKMLPKTTAREEKVMDITSKQQRNPKTVAMVTKPKLTSQLSSSRPVVKQPVLARKNKPAPMKTTYGASFGKPNVNRAGPASGRKSAKHYVDSILVGATGECSTGTLYVFRNLCQ
jgi:hypothetical protein